MRLLIFPALALIASAALVNQACAADTLTSHVYHYDELKVTRTDAGMQQQVLDGATGALKNFEIHVNTLQPRQAPHAAHKHDAEEIMIVREGMLKVTLGDKSYTLGPKSIAFAMAGDMHGVANAGNTPVTYYVLKYSARASLDPDRGRRNGGSFVVNWDTLAVHRTEKGHRRDLYNHPTAQFGMMEMHATMLAKNGEISHPAHQHKPEEMLIMIRGYADMQMGHSHFAAGPGDLIFLSSLDWHHLTNASDGECEYYAFTWAN